jgi:hypothetical protein
MNSIETSRRLVARRVTTQCGKESTYAGTNSPHLRAHRDWVEQHISAFRFITAHGTREVIIEANESGVQSVVLKPFTPAELAEGVARRRRVPVQTARLDDNLGPLR